MPDGCGNQTGPPDCRKRDYKRGFNLRYGQFLPHWTGKEALENGLVDKLGSLEDAINIAADLAGVETYKVRNYPNYEKDLKDIFKGPFASVKASILKDELGIENYQIYKSIKQFSGLKGIQTRLPFLLEIK